jgi:seryl-tRNA(Sec) selenium transferase
MTVLGASIMVPQAVAAMAAIAGEFVEMDAACMQAASRVVAQATGGEAGFITACCASAITLAVAGAMTGERLLAIERLPDTTGLRNEVLVQLGHLVGYGASLQQTIEMTGARVVPVGTVSMAQPYQLDESITEQTACAVFVVSHMTVQYAMLALEQVCAASAMPRACR